MSPNSSSIDPTTYGCEWIVDAHDCVADRLRELHTLRQLCDRVIRELQLNVVGQPCWHQFPGEAGVTGLYLLSESHLACHTYPETGLATFNLYCCRHIPDWPWTETLHELLGAQHVEFCSIPRGVLSTHIGGNGLGKHTTSGLVS